ncbi:hypothetical protein EGR_08777 [Echinococcus granulosus]|uniref:Uncharacterized protein n=1 Tax=Echinococcus granulosus TaxID=6210 RepID=W6U7L2_ECHGR|nr:hypothetical protein EGR_08777 [Echinococcus granulosus]EUB56351.1 hypothetical protein EGR_08777 [Echinococcus granulosus]
MPRMKHMRRREQCNKSVSVYIIHRHCLVALFTCKRYCLVALQPPVASQKGEGEAEMGKDQSGSVGAVNKRGGRTLHSPRCSRVAEAEERTSKPPNAYWKNRELHVRTSDASDLSICLLSSKLGREW